MRAKHKMLAILYKRGGFFLSIIFFCFKTFLFVFCFTSFANFIYIFFNFLFLWQNINLCAFQMVFRLYFPLSPAHSLPMSLSHPFSAVGVFIFIWFIFNVLSKSALSQTLHSLSILFTHSLCQSFLSLPLSCSPLSPALFSLCACQPNGRSFLVALLQGANKSNTKTHAASLSFSLHQPPPLF